MSLGHVESVAEPEELASLLAEFDPVVTFRSVPAVDLPVCAGCPPCDPSGGCDSVAVLVHRKYLGLDVEADRLIYSHTARMPVGSCCWRWELKTLLRQGYQVTVEILMTKEVAR